MSVSLLSKPNRSAAIGENVSGPTEVILIRFDASISERYSRRKEVAQHPVEAGADVSDHARTLPTEITIRGWVTDDPIVVLRSLNATPSVRGGDPQTRVANAWKELNRIMDEESEVKVLSGLDDFRNMILKSIDVARDKDSGRILDATITLQQITIATTDVIDAPTPRPAPGKKSSPRSEKTEAGKKNGKPPENVSGIRRLGRAALRVLR